MRRMAFALGGLLLASAAAPGLASAPGPSAPLPGSTCLMFPADNAWNMRVDGLPKHAKNKIWKQSTHAASTLVHPDFGPSPYGIPVNVVTNSHANVAVTFNYADESDIGPYPFDNATLKEGGSDQHALMVNADSCTLYELYHAQWNGGAPTGGSGAIWDLTSNDLRPAGWTSADAAGLPILPGMVRYDEIQAGTISHALRVTFDCTSGKYLWPARHQAATGGKTCPPMGARFRLRSSFDQSGFSPQAQVLITALKQYGVINADNGSDWYITGTMDNNWNDNLLDEWKSIPARAFVAIDASGCQVSPDSGAFAAGPACPIPA